MIYQTVMKSFPNKNLAFPNPAIPSLCYIKNVVKNPRIIVGDYTYYDDVFTISLATSSLSVISAQ